MQKGRDSKGETKGAIVWFNVSAGLHLRRQSTHPLSILDRFERGPSGSCPIKVPAVSPEYVDPGSDGGRYE